MDKENRHYANHVREMRFAKETTDYYNTDGTTVRKVRGVPEALDNKWLKGGRGAGVRRTAASRAKAVSYSGDDGLRRQSAEAVRSEHGSRPEQDTERASVKRRLRDRMPLMVAAIVAMFVLTGLLYSITISMTQRIHREVDATRRNIRICEKNIADLNADLNEANSRKTVMQFAAALGMTNTNPYEIRIDANGTGAANGAVAAAEAAHEKH